MNARKRAALRAMIADALLAEFEDNPGLAVKFLIDRHALWQQDGKLGITLPDGEDIPLPEPMVDYVRALVGAGNLKVQSTQ